MLARMSNEYRRLTAVSLALSLIVAASNRLAIADDVSPPSNERTFVLQYKFKPGERLRWKIVHLGVTETKIQGNKQTSRSRSVSTKVWEITGVDAEGNITLTHLVDDVDMSQQVTGQAEVTYNSATDKTVPPEYQHVAKTVGVPLTQAVITPSGKLVERKSEAQEFQFGVGELATPLPEAPVKIGDSWSAPNEIQVRLRNGQVKQIKTRQKFTLQKVLTGVATVAIETQVLTPVREPEIESQLVQQLTKGEFKFDIDAGRIISKQLDWNEKVIGFNRADSLMQYQARFTEELLGGQAATAGNDDAAGAEDAKTAKANRDDKPALRR